MVLFLRVKPQARNLEVLPEGECWLILDWKKPVDDGAVDHKIQRLLHPDGPCSDAGLAMESEITLNGQAHGKEWEYRVIPVNKVGEGEPSNTVMAVL